MRHELIAYCLEMYTRKSYKEEVCIKVDSEGASPIGGSVAPQILSDFLFFFPGEHLFISFLWSDFKE